MERRLRAAFFRLIGSVAFENGPERLGDKLDVRREVRMANVFVVEAHPVFESYVAATADLPEAGKSRPYGKAHLVPWEIFADFGRERGTGTDDGHVSPKNVEQLGKLVEAEFSENATHRIDARIVLHLERRTARFVELFQFLLAFFRIDIHAAELVHGKELSVFSDAGLLEDDRAFGIAYLDNRRAGDKQRGKENDSAERGNHVESPLDDFLGVERELACLDVGVEKPLERKEAVVAEIEFLDGRVELLSFFSWRPV